MLPAKPNTITHALLRSSEFSDHHLLIQNVFVTQNTSRCPKVQLLPYRGLIKNAQMLSAREAAPAVGSLSENSKYIGCKTGQGSESYMSLLLSNHGVQCRNTQWLLGT